VLTHSDSMVLPHGGRKAFCGTNPICITAPTADPSSPLCLDMATSITPWNSIVNAAIEGVLLPDGWAVDADGQDTRDANRVAAVYPAAEHKGSGLGIMIDVLCALLGTGPYGPDIPAMYGGDAAANRCLGGLVGAIDVSRFVPLDIFRQRTSELRQRLNAWPTRADVDMVLAPGQPEDLTRAKRVREGVPLGVELLKKFDSIASQFGVQRLASYPMPET
jgi:ureidoglycolate dehydrogenase (NAD+)